ncbi:TonB family protein [Roseovarius sp.]|uniref:cell envelope integrity protein TolA n=1 Tax=Roseovarius sp. TaxID=1486281 RepID=UPI003BAB63BB
MIRRSLLVAAVAILLSLLTHLLLLNFATREVSRTEGSAPPPPPDVSGTFDDFVESAPEPVEPEPTPPMEKPEVTSPDQVEDSLATSNALVESDNPQSDITPGTDASETITPDAAQPSETGEEAETELAAQQPETPDPTPETAQPAEETPDTPDDPVEEARQPDAPQVTIEATEETPDIPATPSEDTVESTAVTRSLRPPKQRPSTEALRSPETAQDDAQPSGDQRTRIQSSGLELLAQNGGLAAASASVFGNLGASGNAEAANYAGRVLTHLNSTARMSTSERGSARVQFQINADGSIAWVRVINSSGSSGIDEAAVAQVRKSAPFPAPPEGTTRQMVFVYHSR